MIERVRDELTEEQVSLLVRKLNHVSTPFVISEKRRSIYLKERGENHPKIGGLPLPVGFIGNNADDTYHAELVNTQYKFFTPFHEKLREQYLSV